MVERVKKNLIKWICGAAPFVLGLVICLAIGWLLFPQIIYGRKEQPVEFSHKLHSEILECYFCHNPGAASLSPDIAACAECHESIELAITSSPDELRLITEYVTPGKEIDWLYHQTQPDNVYFSHIPHSLETCATPSCHPYWREEPEQFCATCHLTVAEIDTTPLEFNRLTGYSRYTMKMDVCENCHASPSHLRESGLTDEQETALFADRPKVRLQANASNACYTCHK